MSDASMHKVTALCVAILVGVVIADSERDFWNAAKDGDLAYVEKALATGVNPHWQNPESFDRTALHVATKFNHAAVISVLLDAGADKDLRDNGGMSPLHIASLYRHTDVAIMLIACGADVTSKDRLKQTALHYASQLNHTAVISAILDAGANKDQQDFNGFTPIYGASHFGATEAVTMLIDHGADVNIPDIYSGHLTPLMVATKEGHLSIVEALIDAHANLSLTDEAGQTALHIAAEWNMQDIAQLLLQMGADAKKQDNNGMTPADWARKKQFLELANIIDSFTAPIVHHITATTTPYYSLYLLTFEVVMFIATSLYLVLH